jgi:hypothetical protein
MSLLTGMSQLQCGSSLISLLKSSILRSQAARPHGHGLVPKKAIFPSAELRFFGAFC